MKHIIKHHKTYQMTQKLPEKKAKISETQEQQPKTRRIPENIPKHIKTTQKTSQHQKHQNAH